MSEGFRDCRHRERGGEDLHRHGTDVRPVQEIQGTGVQGGPRFHRPDVPPCRHRPSVQEPGFVHDGRRADPQPGGFRIQGCGPVHRGRRPRPVRGILRRRGPGFHGIPRQDPGAARHPGGERRFPDAFGRGHHQRIPQLRPRGEDRGSHPQQGLGRSAFGQARYRYEHLLPGREAPRQDPQRPGEYLGTEVSGSYDTEQLRDLQHRTSRAPRGDGGPRYASRHRRVVSD